MAKKEKEKESKDLTDAIADAVGEAARKGTKKVLESVVEKAEGLVSTVTPDVIQQGLGLKKESDEVAKKFKPKTKKSKVDRAEEATPDEKKEGKKAGKKKKK